jgi:hypothetical protein
VFNKHVLSILIGGVELILTAIRWSLVLVSLSNSHLV